MALTAGNSLCFSASSYRNQRRKMQSSAGLSLLTTVKPPMIRGKERKLYELIADRQIPCTKVTGRWLFSRADLDRWLLSGMVRAAGVLPPEPPPIVGGSHDPLLQWALSESRAGLAILSEGSEAGYQRFLRGELIAAAIHFHDLDDPARDANPEAVAAEPTLRDAVLIGFVAREQGLVVAAGNPLKLTSLGEAHARKLRAALRPAGAGANSSCSPCLRKDGLGFEDLRTALVAPTGADIGQAIRAGHADFGIATRAVATAAGLDFVPLLRWSASTWLCVSATTSVLPCRRCWRSCASRALPPGGGAGLAGRERRRPRALGAVICRCLASLLIKAGQFERPPLARRTRCRDEPACCSCSLALCARRCAGAWRSCAAMAVRCARSRSRPTAAAPSPAASMRRRSSGRFPRDAPRRCCGFTTAP